MDGKWNDHGYHVREWCPRNFIVETKIFESYARVGALRKLGNWIFSIVVDQI